MSGVWPGYSDSRQCQLAPSQNPAAAAAADTELVKHAWLVPPAQKELIA